MSEAKDLGNCWTKRVVVFRNASWIHYGGLSLFSPHRPTLETRGEATSVDHKLLFAYAKTKTMKQSMRSKLEIGKE